jgi:lysophospholipase L1-like esterase
MFSDLARVYLAQAHEAKGDKAKAADVVISREFYRSFSGGTPIRLDTVYNDIMRQVAAQHHVTLVDGAGALNAQPSVFIDYCHFNEDGHRRIGELLADRVSVMLGVQQTAQSL